MSMYNPHKEKVKVVNSEIAMNHFTENYNINSIFFLALESSLMLLG